MTFGLQPPILPKDKMLEPGAVSRRRPLSLLWVQIRSKLMAGDDPTSGGLDGKDPLSGDSVPLIDSRPRNPEDFRELSGAADDFSGSGNSFDSQSGLIHADRGNSVLPSASINNYGEPGNGTLHIEEMEKDSLGSRLAKARKDANLSQSAIAKEFGITRNAVSLWESDVNAPTTDKIARIADLTGVSVGYLLSGVDARNVQKNEIPHPLEMPRDVPVLGTAACGEDGAFVFESTTIDLVRRPPRLRGVAGVYALYIQGSSMAPWREEGETVYVHPRQPVQIGDYVVVQTGSGGKPSAAYIKRLIKRTGSEIRLEQFRPPEELSFSPKRIISIHRILSWSELLGL